MKKIILTGGGTAGHVTPNIALLPGLKKLDYHIEYIGSYKGIEKSLIEEQNIPYHGISSGKLRRYFSWQNFIDPFKILRGYFQAKRIIKKIKPDIVFSKGGFVSVPVVYAAAKAHIPIIIHESDITPGLANKLASKKANKVCCNFPETVKYFPSGKAICTGSPIRSELLMGNANKGYEFTALPEGKPNLLIMGGSLGSEVVNEAVRTVLNELIKTFNVIHLCGKGKVCDTLIGVDGYVQYEYIGPELADIFAMTDIVISRAGANSICELLALRKPSILIPLSAKASRGDQILNAKSFKKQGFSEVIEEEEITPELLLDTVHKLYNNQIAYTEAMSMSPVSNGVSMILNLIKEHSL